MQRCAARPFARSAARASLNITPALPATAPASQLPPSRARPIVTIERPVRPHRGICTREEPLSEILVILSVPTAIAVMALAFVFAVGSVGEPEPASAPARRRRRR